MVIAATRPTRARRGRLRAAPPRARRRLARGQLTVVDATNVSASSRRALLARAAAAGVPATAIVLDLPAEIVLARNAARRPRVVDEAVVRHHLARLRASLDGPARTPRAKGFAAGRRPATTRPTRRTRFGFDVGDAA